MTEALPSLGVFGLALLPLLGVWLGQRLQGRTGHAAWLRDKRLEVYIDALEFLSEYPDSPLERAWEVPGYQGPGASEPGRLSEEHWGRFGALSVRLGLLGPGGVERAWSVAVREADEASHEARLAIQDEAHAPDLNTRAAAAVRAGEAQRGLELAMRRALRGERWWKNVARRT
ncbi:hypothetical protein AVL62_08765 [Serinicoccus chungangensis]|uniref:Uncharacterized protein n=1 Tax=Serinicoccus chungangensis TaxID=767452 RepID=A0A0W8I138_9MICO|nr:hypothetical protein [Serinicoccus chungangensis]KUG51435.1 hypothetical protein AVL62_08765 [Serinicoccus chungangensis]